MLSRNNILSLDSPGETTISINFNNREFVEIDLVQVLNIETSESKTPIFGFENQSFHSVLSGKRVITGQIVIKKSSQEAIINTIYNDNDEKLNDSLKKRLLSKIDTIYELLDNKLDELKIASAGEKIAQVTEDYIIQQKNKFAPELIMAEISNRVSSISQMNNKTIKDLLDIGHQYPIKLKIKNNNSNLIVNDVHFLSKSTSIDINQEDIDDVYNFIGNVEKFGG